jgi:hypothetical protein
MTIVLLLKDDIRQRRISSPNQQILRRRTASVLLLKDDIRQQRISSPNQQILRRLTPPQNLT